MRECPINSDPSLSFPVFTQDWVFIEPCFNISTGAGVPYVGLRSPLYSIFDLIDNINLSAFEKKLPI